MKIKDFFSDIKTWIVIVIFFIGIGFAFAGWAKLPEKVKEVEAKTKATDDKVQSVATTLETYIKVEAVKDEEKEKARKEEKEMMNRWIEQVSKKR